MDFLDSLRARYQQYTRDMQAAKKASPNGGSLGLGSDPRKSPCNQAFYDDVGKWVDELLLRNPRREEIFAATEYILQAPIGRERELTYGFLFAAQAHCRRLIPYLTPEERASIWAWYDRAFPKNKRLPVHTEIAALLSGVPAKKTLFL